MQTWAPEDIRTLRKRFKLSQRVLGILLGVTDNCIYQWERGVRRPSKTTKILLARIERELAETKTRQEVKEYVEKNAGLV